MLNEKPTIYSYKEIGQFQLDHDIAGYQLQQISSTSGGCKAISDRLNNREMNEFLKGFIAGWEMKKGGAS